MSIEELKTDVNGFRPSYDPKADIVTLSKQLAQALECIEALQQRVDGLERKMTVNPLVRSQANQLRGSMLGR